LSLEPKAPICIAPSLLTFTSASALNFVSPYHSSPASDFHHRPWVPRISDDHRNSTLSHRNDIHA
jgi:hypothetical protein